MTIETTFHDVQIIVERFSLRVKEEFEDRLKQWKVDLSQSEVHEVVGALLARQTTLTLQLAGCPAIWNGDVAPLILRAMADVYISLVWVLRSPVERSQKFIYYGLGQAKLQLEHRRAELQSRDPAPGEIEHNSAIEEWINAQRATFLTDVNLGSWSGISTRAMAAEAGCLDFYNYVYTPFSACTHSMWKHIAIYNLQVCKNPLHRHHRIPLVSVDPRIDIYYLHLAGKYIQKTFKAFDQATGTISASPSAFEVLCDDLEAVANSSSESGVFVESSG